MEERNDVVGKRTASKEERTKAEDSLKGKTIKFYFHRFQHFVFICEQQQQKRRRFGFFSREMNTTNQLSTQRVKRVSERLFSSRKFFQRISSKH